MKKIKKIALILLSFLTLGLGGYGLSSCAYSSYDPEGSPNFPTEQESSPLDFYYDGNSGGGFEVSSRDDENLPSELVLPSRATRMSYVDMEVTKIADEGFKNCDNIKKVSIPDSITEIGANAFYGCDRLEELVIPASVKKIGEAAFADCNNLKSVKFLGAIEEIPEMLFSDCENLQSLELKEGVKKLGSGFISGTYRLGELLLPQSVEEIDSNALSSAALARINLPASLKEIGEEAFLLCRNLYEIQDQSSLGITMEDMENYGALYVRRIYSEGESNIVYEGDFLFYQEEGVKVLVGYRGEERVLKIPEGTTGISEEALFGNSALLSLTLPTTLEEIGENTLKMRRLYEICNKSSLEIEYFYGYIYSTEEYTRLSVDENGFIFYDNNGKPYLAGYEGEKTEIEFPETAEGIMADAFSYYDFTKVIIPETIKTIEDGAFWYMPYLKSVEIKKGVEYIWDHAFGGCERLSDISLPSGIKGIGFDAFNGTAFYKEKNNWQNKDDALYIGEYLIEIKSCPETYWVKEGTTLVADMANSCGSLKNIYFPASLKRIGGNAFFESEKLENVVFLGNNLESIGAFAFAYCDKLNSITFPSSLKSIAGGAFSDCTGLSEICLSENVTIIGIDAFKNCSGAKTLELSKVEDIQKGAFQGCVQLNEIIIPDSTRSVAEKAFYGCTSAKKITLGKALSYIGNGAFSECTAVEEIKLYARCCETDMNWWSSSVGNQVFRNTGIASGIKVFIGATVESITQNFFYGRKTNSTTNDNTFGVASIEFEEGSLCKTIGQSAFGYNEAIVEVRLPEGLLGIDMWAFYQCTGLKRVNIPASVTALGGYAFGKCTGLEEVRFLATACEVSTNPVFSGASLTNAGKSVKLVFGKNVTRLPDNLFKECDAKITVFYETGYEETALDWGEGNDGFTILEQYYFSLTQTEVGHRWRYNQNGEIEIWQIEA
ncbi:MAG: leucine-rich repeat domain-containing protein [Clostridia bacterium]|nr:leucine-rich repeat domain-containing protein [Clostridia bacterium]